MHSYSRIKLENLSMIALTSLLIACKFDEIDYCLPSIKILLEKLRTSKSLLKFVRNFKVEDVMSCEEEISKNILNWNFDQITPFHVV